MSSLTATTEAARRPARPGVLHSTWLIMWKDLRLEYKSRARVNATLFFSVMTLLMFSFAVGPHAEILAHNAPGFLWLAIFLSSVLALGESLRVEADNDALDGLRLLPVSPAAIFLGKALVSTLFLSCLGLLMLPVALALYGAELNGKLGVLVLTLFLGSAGVSAPGTLYAAVAVQARARDVLLPVLLFPILVPGLLAAVRATSLVLTGDPMGQLGSWLGLLTAFAVVYWSLCATLFGRVIEE